MTALIRSFALALIAAALVAGCGLLIALRYRSRRS